jgi:hypothetical protein
VTNNHDSDDKNKQQQLNSFLSLYFSDRASWYQSIFYYQLDAHMFYFVI